MEKAAAVALKSFVGAGHYACGSGSIVAGLESSVGMEEHCWTSQQWRPQINR